MKQVIRAQIDTQVKGMSTSENSLNVKILFSRHNFTTDKYHICMH